MSQTIQVDDIVLYYGDHIKIPMWLFHNDLERFRRNYQENRILVRVSYPKMTEPSYTRQEIPVNLFSFEIEMRNSHEKGLVYTFGRETIINHLIKEILNGGVLLPRLNGEMIIFYRQGNVDFTNVTTTNHVEMYHVRPVMSEEPVYKD